MAVIDKRLSYYIDGKLMTANSATLIGPIDDEGGGVRIGQKYGGKLLLKDCMAGIYLTLRMSHADSLWPIQFRSIIKLMLNWLIQSSSGLF